MKKGNYENMVFGIRAIIETIESGKEIDKLMLQKGLSNDLMKQLVGVARTYGIPINNVPIEKLNRLTKKNHQGAIAFVSAIHYAALDHVISAAYEKGQEPLILILDRITDVRNFGAIARSAECAGVHGIVVPSRGGAAINADAMKTSAGALNYIPVSREDNLKQAIQFLKDSGITIIGCTEKTDDLLYDIDMKRPVAIIMGSEEDGISAEYLKLCDHRMKIPMAGQIDSLNVSVSSALAVYEAVRQRSL